MNTVVIEVTGEATLISIARMFEQGFRILPVVNDGKVTRSVTRHDFLRACFGIGPGMDE